MIFIKKGGVVVWVEKYSQRGKITLYYNKKDRILREA